MEGLFLTPEMGTKDAIFSDVGERRLLRTVRFNNLLTQKQKLSQNKKALSRLPFTSSVNDVAKNY